jgi:lysozyme
MMKTSEAGRALIRRFEGCRLKAYLCPAGIPTIGIGHIGPDVTLADVKSGKAISAIQADALLEKDLATAEAAVSRLLKVIPTQGQFDALVSFVYNVGEGAFNRSSIRRDFNTGDLHAAADAFLLYDKAHTGAGEVALAGLHARRAAERALFLS